MVSVQVRNAGQAIWTAMTLPTSVQAAQTVAGAVRTLNLADQVRVQASAPAPGLNIRV